MAYDEEFDVHFVTTTHNQDLTVCPGQPGVYIWVGERDVCWPLVLENDEDALLLAMMLVEAVLVRGQS